MNDLQPVAISYVRWNVFAIKIKLQTIVVKDVCAQTSDPEMREATRKSASKFVIVVWSINIHNMHGAEGLGQLQPAANTRLTKLQINQRLPAHSGRSNVCTHGCIGTRDC